MGVYVIMGFKLDQSRLRELVLPLDPETMGDIIVGFTDYDEYMVGISMLDMGDMGVDRCCGEINLGLILQKLTDLRQMLRIDGTLCVAEVNTPLHRAALSTTEQNCPI